MHCGIPADFLFGEGAQQRLLGLVQFILAVIDPAETVQVGAILGFQLERAGDQLLGFVEAHTAVGVHVAEIVQRAGIVGVQLQHFAELGFGAVVILNALVHGAAHEIDGLFILLGFG